MSLTKEITDKKVNFEFNKEFINVLSKKIKDNDTEFLNKTLKELHPADSADLIENLVPESRSKLIELEGFNLDPEIFIELPPEEKVPLEPQKEEIIITDLGQSPSSYIPNTIFPEHKEGNVLREQPRMPIPKKIYHQ